MDDSSYSLVRLDDILVGKAVTGGLFWSRHPPRPLFRYQLPMRGGMAVVILKIGFTSHTRASPVISLLPTDPYPYSYPYPYPYRFLPSYLPSCIPSFI